MGDYTFLSSKGSSLIDYVLMSESLFPYVSSFIIHDLYDCSSHVPVQVSFKVQIDTTNIEQGNVNIEKLIWDPSRAQEFKEKMQLETRALNNIVDGIISNNAVLSSGIDSFADVLYSQAFSVFGASKSVNQNKTKYNRKFKSPWYTQQCEIARRELQSANRAFRKHKSDECRTILMDKRRSFCRIKRYAKRKYQSDQKQRLQDIAKSQPQKFWDELRRIRGSDKTATNLTAEDFFDHFNNLYSSSEAYKNEEVEATLSNNTIPNTTVNELDHDFSEEEIDKAINVLKCRKSPGVDLLIAEVFIEARAILSPILCKLFNFMYVNSLYPDSWAKGIIVPIPKKGNKNDVNNYRGITLTSVFSKIFSNLLDTRLRTWAEENHVLSEMQFGFRKQKSTIDCVFILSSIINKIITKEKKKLYCAFVDFKKAFDLVYRDGIWYKLLQSGASSKFVNMLKAIYKKGIVNRLAKFVYLAFQKREHAA